MIFEQTHFKIGTDIFCNLDKHILKFDQIYFAIWFFSEPYACCPTPLFFTLSWVPEISPYLIFLHMTNFSPHVSQVIQVTNMRYGDDAADAGKKSLSLRIYKNFSNPNGNPSQMFLNRQSAEISLNCPTNFAPSHQSCCYNIETQTATLQNIAILLQYWNAENCSSKYLDDSILKHNMETHLILKQGQQYKKQYKIFEGFSYFISNCLSSPV